MMVAALIALGVLVVVFGVLAVRAEDRAFELERKAMRELARDKDFWRIEEKTETTTTTTDGGEA